MSLGAEDKDMNDFRPDMQRIQRLLAPWDALRHQVEALGADTSRIVGVVSAARFRLMIAEIIQLAAHIQRSAMIEERRTFAARAGFAWAQFERTAEPTPTEEQMVELFKTGTAKYCKHLGDFESRLTRLDQAIGEYLRASAGTDSTTNRDVVRGLSAGGNLFGPLGAIFGALVGGAVAAGAHNGRAAAAEAQIHATIDDIRQYLGNIALACDMIMFLVDKSFARELEATLGNVAGAPAVALPDKLCPQCAEAVRGGARICRFCRYEFDAST